MSQLTQLYKADLSADPMVQFEQWFSEAQQLETYDPTAMVLSTVDQHNIPDSRVVLFREIIENQFVFYTNYHSDKGQQLAHNPHAALNFHWANAQRQVRIRGKVALAPSDVSDRYFAQRPHGSQLAALVSQQSTAVLDRHTLDQQFQKKCAEYPNQSIHRPNHWGGYMLKPFCLEYWQARKNRYHDRFRYSLAEDKWHIERLFP